MQSIIHKLKGSALIAALLLSGPVASGLAAEPVRFAEAWLLAQERDAGLAAARANLTRAEHLQDAARGQFYPRVDLVGSYERLDQPITLDATRLNPLAVLEGAELGDELLEALGDSGLFQTELTRETVSRVGIAAVWPLYSGGRISAEQDVAAAGRDASQESFQLGRQALFRETVTRYCGVRLLTRLLETRSVHLHDLDRHLYDARALEREGIIARVARLSIEAAHAKVKVERDRVRRELELAQLSLAELLVEATPPEPLDPLFINETVPTLEPLVASALAQNPAFGALDARAREAQAVVELQKSRWRPELFLFGDVTVYEDDTIAADLIPDWTVGIGAKFTLIDRLGRNDSLAAAHSAADAVRYLRMDLEHEIRLGVALRHREAQQALESVAGLHASVALAEEALALQEKAFVQGLATAPELVDARRVFYADSLLTQG